MSIFIDQSTRVCVQGITGKGERSCGAVISQRGGHRVPGNRAQIAEERSLAPVRLGLRAHGAWPKPAPHPDSAIPRPRKDYRRGPRDSRVRPG